MRVFVCLLVALVAGRPVVVAAADHFGQVTFNGLPVPGVTVTARQGSLSSALGTRQVVVATSDEDGIYHLADLAAGPWTLAIEMPGFARVERQITVPNDRESPVVALTVLSMDELSRTTPPAGGGSGYPRATLRVMDGEHARVSGPKAAPLVDLAVLIGPTGMGAAEGLLINGSLNNGASTPFALPRGIGNDRPRLPTVRSYAIGLQLGNSAWDARPYSLTGARPIAPSYTDTQLLGTFESQVRMPGLRNAITLTLSYQGSSATTANTQSARVPTDGERTGDFSRTFDVRGNPVDVIDPTTGHPFEGNLIPAARISPQAAALLAYFPRGDSAATAHFNYQSPVINATRQDGLRSRASYRVNNRHQVGAAGSYQHMSGHSTSLLSFEDSRRSSLVDAQGNWTWTHSRNTNVTARYGYSHTSNDAIPFFANRLNVSGAAGIAGNDQDPRNWGPPTLTFASDLAALTDGQYSSVRERSHSIAADLTQTRGLHTLGAGGEFRIRANDTFGQQDPRGSFGFTGAATGVDIADFLLGLPQTSAIAVGDPLKLFRGNTAAAYVTDDWRVRSNITLTYGLRWEYESPVREANGRLAMLDLASDFHAAVPVLAGQQGAITGRRYADALVNADGRGVEPRVGLAWRPRLGSSLVVRAGYGLYRSTNVYQPIASLLAIQPPLSTTFNVGSTVSRPLTLAGFTPTGVVTTATFAVDPDFRVPTVQTWDASVQRDLPGSLTVLISYQGSNGRDLMQMSLPNTYPTGVINPCLDCPTGFRYLTSNGRSNRHAVSFQVRRRLSGGFTSTVQYTLAKSMDNAAAFGGASLEGSALMQNWRDPEAEYARSNFDQRHLVTASVEHTTGAGVSGGTLIDGWAGRLLKDWTFSATVNAGSGLPLTAVYFAPVAGTGILGSLRPDLTGVTGPAAAGAFANAASFAPPAAGTWGNAPRNSITGPAAFSLNAGVTRTFRINARLNVDWRVDASNLLNRVTYASVNTLITSPQFGLPNRVNDMRRVRTSIRIRF